MFFLKKNQPPRPQPVLLRLQALLAPPVAPLQPGGDIGGEVRRPKAAPQEEGRINHGKPPPLHKGWVTETMFEMSYYRRLKVFFEKVGQINIEIILMDNTITRPVYLLRPKY